ncbi:MAG TPA: aminotransferase class I/II-fold pyridoxal phosphate-dependent enzyme, partial [Nitrolancea sp.]|nr:aminotransferase class I/II-fold pyridoxal phosphate-dependent enzyme [Nitrolancea sp.]
GKLTRHIYELREIYRVKCERMLKAMERDMTKGVEWTRPNGGFFIWVTLPESVDAIEILPQCRAAGVDYIPGTAFFTDGRGRQNLRLSFSAVTPEEIDQGIARLAGVIRAAQA